MGPDSLRRWKRLLLSMNNGPISLEADSCCVPSAAVFPLAGDNGSHDAVLHEVDVTLSVAPGD